MDRVRFGRALGMGARAAARSAMEAVQAASAPDPRAPQGAATRATTAPRQPEARTRPSVLPPLRVAQSVGPAVRSASTRVAGPIRQAGRALWHEVTGSFFALFALSFGVAVWHMRATALSPVQADRFRFYAFCFFAVLFGYFSVSSFVRARRKG